VRPIVSVPKGFVRRHYHGSVCPAHREILARLTQLMERDRIDGCSAPAVLLMSDADVIDGTTIGLNHDGKATEIT
jgi:hypothetical protein